MADELAARLDAALIELSPELRALAYRNIENLRQEIEITQQELVRLLEDETSTPEARSTAAWIVGLLRESSFTKVLGRVILETRQPVVLWEATKALIMLKEGGELFRSMLKRGPSDEHRKAAAYALGHIGDTSETQLLIRILSDRAEPPGLRAQVAEALGYLGDRAAFSALVAAAVDPSAEVRFWSVFALGSLGDKRAVPLLEQLAKEDHAIVEGWWAVSQEATSALEELHQADEPPPA